MDLAAGIDKDWSIAQKTIEKLNMMGVSHVVLVMQKDGNLVDYKNKGRPTNEEVWSIEMNGDLHKELAKLKITYEI